MLIAATVVAFILMMRTDRRAAAPLLPSDAFSLRSGTGAGLWMVLLMSVGYSPLDLRAALFAALARGQSAGRGLHGRLGVVGVDHSRALSGIALGGMASAIDHYGSLCNGHGSRWSGSFNGARTGRGPDPANRFEQAGFALGAAIAGLVANASGLDNGLDPRSVLRALLRVPLALVAAPLAACAIGVRLNLMVPRSREQGPTAARND
jgi:hypothetical protein